MAVTADWLGAIAETATAFAAFAALCFGIYQIRSARHQQREATAKALYGEAMRLALQYPDLAVPDYRELAGKNELPKYKFYLSYLLYACEEILMNLNDPEWIKSIKYNLAFHAEYIGSEDFAYGEGFYAPELVAIMKEAVAGRDSDSTLRREGTGQNFARRIIE